MSDQAIHPSPDELGAFSLGQLPADQSARIESHVSQCETCCETLLNISSSDTFIALLQEAEKPAGEETLGHEESHTGSSSSCDPSADIPTELLEHPRYRIVEPVGVGGMGRVYRAEHRMMERTVAIKVINRQLVDNPQAIERFQREVKAAAKLAHPNIVAAYDAEQAGEVHFLAMEFVEGIDLAEMVKSNGALPVQQACEYIRQAALGLQHAHERGMIHRDIKPQNLMITSRESRFESREHETSSISPGSGPSTLDSRPSVKILDFGLASLASDAMPTDDTAQARSDLTTAGTIMGTPDFISPEQADDARQADVRSDIYSLGATLYFLLTGRPPFDEGSVMQKLKSHANTPPEPIENLRVDVPVELATVIRRMMAKDPRERFRTPAEVADALAPFVDEYRTRKTGVQPIHEDLIQPTPPRRRQFRAVRVTLLLLSIVVLAALVYVVTDTGTLVIESEDENVEIAVRPLIHESHEGNRHLYKWQYRIGDTMTGSTVKRLRSGAYIVDLQGRENEFEVNQDQFILSRGGKVIVKVTRRDVSRAEMHGKLEQTDKPEPTESVVSDRSNVRRSAEPVRVIPHGGSISSLVYLPDGKIVTSSYHEANEEWRLHYTLPSRPGPGLSSSAGANGVSQVVATPDGKWIAFGSRIDHRVVLWDAERFQPVHTFDTGGMVHGVSFSPDGRLLAAASWDGSAKVWSVQSLDLVKELSGYGRVHRVQFSPDGSTLAVSETPSGRTDLWDTNRWTKRATCTHGHGVGKMAFSPDNKWLATGGAGLRGSEREKLSIKVWDASSGKLLVRFDEMQNAVEQVAISPDSRYLIAVGGNWGADPNWGGEPHEAEPIRIWDLPTQRLVAEFDGHDRWVRGIVFAPDGNHFATADMKEVKVWNLDAIVHNGWTQLFNGKDLTGWKYFPEQEGEWQVAEGILTSRGPPSHLFSERVDYQDFHLRVEARINDGGDGGVFIRSPFSVRRLGSLDVWAPQGIEAQIMYHANPGKTGTLLGHRTVKTVVAESPIRPNEWFTMEVIAKGEVITVRIDGDQVSTAVDSQNLFTDGHIVLQHINEGTRSEFRKIEVIDLSPSAKPSIELNEIRHLEGHTEMIDAVAFMPDGMQIVTGGFDETIRIWDAKSGKLLDTIHTPHAVLCLAVSPDGKTVVSGMFGTQVVLWDLNTKRDVQHFIGHERGNWRGGQAGKILAVAFSPDGTRLASGGEDLTLRVWDVASGKQLVEYPFNGTPVQTIAWTSDGERILCGEYDGTMTWCNVETRQFEQRSDGEADGKWFALSPDDRRTAANDGIRDAGTFALVRKLENEDDIQFLSPQFTRDGRFVIASSGPGLVRVWDAVTGSEVARFEDAPAQANKLAVSPEGRSVAFGGGGRFSIEEDKLIKSDDYALRVWQLPESVWPKAAANQLDQSPAIQTEDPAARRLFRKFERTIQEADAASVIYEGEIMITKDGKTTRESYRGAFQAVPGGKTADYEPAGSRGHRSGPQMTSVDLFYDPSPYDFYINQITRSGFGESPSSLQARWYMWQIKNLRRVAEEKVNSANCEVIAYTLQPAKDMSQEVKLWIEKNTLVPRQRELRYRRDDADIVVTERYRGFNTDAIAEPFGEHQLAMHLVGPPPRRGRLWVRQDGEWKETEWLAKGRCYRAEALTELYFDRKGGIVMLNPGCELFIDNDEFERAPFEIRDGTLSIAYDSNSRLDFRTAGVHFSDTPLTSGRSRITASADRIIVEQGSARASGEKWNEDVLLREGVEYLIVDGVLAPQEKRTLPPEPDWGRREKVVFRLDANDMSTVTELLTVGDFKDRVLRSAESLDEKRWSEIALRSPDKFFTLSPATVIRFRYRFTGVPGSDPLRFHFHNRTKDHWHGAALVFPQQDHWTTFEIPIDQFGTLGDNIRKTSHNGDEFDQIRWNSISSSQRVMINQLEIIEESNTTEVVESPTSISTEAEEATP